MCTTAFSTCSLIQNPGMSANAFQRPMTRNRYSEIRPSKPCPKSTDSRSLLFGIALSLTPFRERGFLCSPLNTPARIIRYQLINLIADGKLKENDNFRRDEFKDGQHFVWKR
jgi:hypothetical protein